MLQPMMAGKAADEVTDNAAGGAADNVADGKANVVDKVTDNTANAGRRGWLMLTLNTGR